MKELTILKTIEDLAELRDQTVRTYETAKRMLEQADEELGKVSHYLFPYKAKPDPSVKDFTRELDQRLWRHAFDKTGLMQYMDAQAKKEFERDLEKNPPTFTVENCRSVLLSTAQQADLMFARGLVEVFLRLSKAHRTNTNEPFKVNRKAVMSCMVEVSFDGKTLHLRYGGISREKLNDLDRVFQTLDGKQHQPHALATAFEDALRHGNTFENAYYKMRGFKNGNLHIEFKREDLLEKANRIIADYCDGRGLADGRS